MRFLLAFISSFFSLIVSIIIVMLFFNLIGRANHTLDDFYTYTFSYTMFGVPLSLLGCIIGEMFYRRIRKKSYLAFALLGWVYGFIIYLLLTNGMITDTVEITSAIGIGIFGAIGSLVFYKVRKSNITLRFHEREEK
ncbi:hypothetical protein [Fictibacillus gelatini]|uniref:hypothetical protein n=1 Tax=Fictibacillus gelatini TaxID=225985 RepID=UPI00047C51D8|nr:hypothetical protein [Fictibacillus gelatini]